MKLFLKSVKNILRKPEKESKIKLLFMFNSWGNKGEYENGKNKGKNSTCP